MSGLGNLPHPEAPGRHRYNISPTPKFNVRSRTVENSDRDVDVADRVEAVNLSTETGQSVWVARSYAVRLANPPINRAMAHTPWACFTVDPTPGETTPLTRDLHPGHLFTVDF